MIGRLRRRVTLQTKARVADGGGGAAESWQNIAIVWARVQPLLQPERQHAEQIQSRGGFKVTIRYRTDVSTHDRVLLDGEALAIKRVRDPDDRHRWLELDCEQGAPS